MQQNKPQDVHSFNVDHRYLERGLYVAGEMPAGETDSILTFDLRLKKPNREEVLTPAQAHALEHCLATAIRAELSKDAADGLKPVYIGPMGCLTGFYVLFLKPNKLTGSDLTAKIVELFQAAVAEIKNMPEVPAANAKQCGNYSLSVPVAELNPLLNDISRIIEQVAEQNNFDTYPLFAADKDTDAAKTR